MPPSFILMHHQQKWAKTFPVGIEAFIQMKLPGIFAPEWDRTTEPDRYSTSQLECKTNKYDVKQDNSGIDEVPGLPVTTTVTQKLLIRRPMINFY